MNFKNKEVNMTKHIFFTGITVTSMLLLAHLPIKNYAQYNNVASTSKVSFSNSESYFTDSSSEYLKGTTKDPYIILQPNSAYSSDWGIFSSVIELFSNVQWTVTVPCDWVSIDPMSGENDMYIDIYFSTNLDTVSRSCTVLFEGGGVSAYLDCGQAAHAYLYVIPKTKYVSSDPSSYEILIYSNSSWAYHATNDWIHGADAGFNNEMRTIFYDENTSAQIRSGQVVFTYSYESFHYYHKLIQAPPAGFEMDINVCLEGPFNGTDMNPPEDYTDFQMVQPFNVPPWNYNGTESLSSIPNNNVVDWILFEKREAPRDIFAYPSTMVERQALLLLNNGRIVGLDGSSFIPFEPNINQNLFLVIWHRNHLGIMSTQCLVESQNKLVYDFTSGVNKVYGGMNAIKEVATDVWGMVGGDGDANGIVEESDIYEWSQSAGNSGYKSGDFNLNGQTDNRDKNEIWLPSLGYSSQIPD